MNPDISLQQTVVTDSDQLYAEVGDETVVLQTDTRMYYSLNPVAGRIWELLQEPRKVNEIRDTVVDEYDVSRARCEDDLFEFLELLSEEDLIEFRG